MSRRPRRSSSFEWVTSEESTNDTVLDLAIFLQVSTGRKSRIILANIAGGVLELKQLVGAIDLGSRSHAQLSASNFDALVNGMAVDPTEIHFFGQDQRPYALECPIEAYQRHLPIRQNCSLSWRINVRDGPINGHSIFMRVENGLPTEMSFTEHSLQVDVELSLSFSDLIRVRTHQADGLEVLGGAGIQGDLPDIMAMGGLINSDEWLQTVFIPVDVGDAMETFGTIFQSSSHATIAKGSRRVGLSKPCGIRAGRGIGTAQSIRPRGLS